MNPVFQATSAPAPARNNYLNSVIFEGDEKNIGKIIKVKIANCNQNSLFGEVVNNNMRAA